MNKNLVLGAPGTGKTTFLVERIKDYLKTNPDLKGVCFLTFTRAAAQEARGRVEEALSIDHLPYFATIHSFAYRHIQTNKKILDNTHLREFAERYNYTLTYDHDTKKTQDDVLKYIVDVAAVKNKRSVPVKQLLNANISLARYKTYVKNYKEYKNKKQLVDYTDILYIFLQQRICPFFKLLIVDEAQDLSTIQWQVVDVIARAVPNIYIAGDDDQSLYTWAGADKTRFLALEEQKYNKIVLDKSYRVPPKIHKVAIKIINKNKDRYYKGWAPLEDGAQGTVKIISNFEQLNYHFGEWLILSRHGYQLKKVASFFYAQGVPFNYKEGRDHKKSLDDQSVQAVAAWATLRDGGTVTATTALLMCGFLSVPLPDLAQNLTILPADTPVAAPDLYLVDFNQDWRKALKIKPKIKKYIDLSVGRGYTFTCIPQVTLSTIHGAKGGECANVVLLTDLSQVTYNAYLRSPDDERRTFYVAVTRAKQSLYVVMPATTRFFPLTYFK